MSWQGVFTPWWLHWLPCNLKIMTTESPSTWLKLFPPASSLFCKTKLTTSRLYLYVQHTQVLYTCYQSSYATLCNTVRCFSESDKLSVWIPYSRQGDGQNSKCITWAAGGSLQHSHRTWTGPHLAQSCNGYRPAGEGGDLKNGHRADNEDSCITVEPDLSSPEAWLLMCRLGFIIRLCKL